MPQGGCYEQEHEAVDVAGKPQSRGGRHRQRAGAVSLPFPRLHPHARQGLAVSDYESLRAEARELEAEDRIYRINARRAWASTQGEPGDQPEFICPGCGLDGECECPEEEVEHEDEGPEVVAGVERGNQAQAVRHARCAEESRTEAEPCEVKS